MCRSFFSLPLLVALLLLGGCKKDKVKPVDQLPPATTTGANTWGCLVNGEVWTGETASQMRADWTTSDLLYATMGRANWLSVIFPDTTHRASQQPGIYPLVRGGNPGNYARLTNMGRSYRPEDLIKGTAQITRLDRQAGIISGTFSFIMSSTPGDTVRVTDGRFDISNMDR